MTWKDIEFDLQSNSPSPPGSDASSPGSSSKGTESLATSATTLLDASDMHIYGPGGLGGLDQRLVVCNECNKTMLESALVDHRVICKRARELVAKKLNASHGNIDGVPEVKKRNLSDASGDESGARKLKEMKKKPSISVKPPNVPKPVRNKGPIDVNTQCGVIIGDSKPCARSLTCKSHSLAQKREVLGRSAPFRVLLAEWQLRNNLDGKIRAQATQVLKEYAAKEKAVLAAGSLLNGGRLGIDISPQKRNKSRQIFFGEMTDSDGSMDEGMLDSEDEVEQVFAGLTAAKHACSPLAQTTFGGAMCVRAKKYGRFRDVFGA